VFGYFKQSTIMCNNPEICVDLYGKGIMEAQHVQQHCICSCW